MGRQSDPPGRQSHLSPAEPHDVLGRLVGVWDVRGEWERVAGAAPVAIAQTARGAWILGDSVVELDELDGDGRHVVKVLYAHARTTADFVAFSAARGAAHFELERGHYDDRRDALVLQADEIPGPGRPPIAYARTITFRADGFDLSITYPGVPPGTYGEMHLRYRPATQP